MLRSAYVRLVLRLNDTGIPWRDAQYAAGQATCRLPDEQDIERLLPIALEALNREVARPA